MLAVVVTQVLGSSTVPPSGLGALGFSGSAFLIQLVTFILAYLVLRRFAFGPILKILKQRRETIARGVSLGEQMERDRLELDKKVQARLNDARSKADGIIADAEDAARDAVKLGETKAQEKAEHILTEAKLRTKQDLERAKRGLEHEIVELVADATEVLTGEKVDRAKDSSLINKALSAQQVKS